MRSRIRPYLTVVFTLLVVGCTRPAGVAPADVPDPPDPTTTPPITQPPDNPPDRPAEDCIPEQLWWSLSHAYGLAPATFEFSPNEGLIYRREAMYWWNAELFRTSDGLPFQSLTSPSGARDQTWSREVIVNADNALVVVEVDSQRALLTVPPPPGTFGWMQPALSAEGETLIAAACLDEEIHVARFMVDTNRETGRVILPGRCDYWRPFFLHLDTTRPGEVLIGVASTGTVHRHDFDSGTTHSAVVHTAPEPGPDQWFYGGPLLAMAVHPDGSRLLTSGNDLQVREWRLPEITPTGRTFATSAPQINLDVYAQPMEVSPVSWSPDGHTLVHVDPDGDVVLRRDRDAEILDVIERPVPMEDPDQWFLENAALNVAFTADSRTFAVSHYHGVAAYQCAGAARPVRSDAPLAVTMEGATQIRLSETAVFTARVEGLAPAYRYAHRFEVDGETLHWFSPSEGGRFEWRPGDAGTYRVAIVVDDGQRTGRAELTITVLP